MSVQKEQGDLKKHANTSWAMTYSHKNQSFMKKRGQHVTHTLSMHKESKVNKVCESRNLQMMMKRKY